MRCSGCGEWKPLDAFAPSFAKRGRGRCRPCHSQYGKDWSASATPDELERIRARRRSDYERSKGKRLASARIRRQSPEWRAKRRSWVLAAAYGITAADYDALLAAQGGRCACCGVTANRNGKRLFVDHDHETGAVRGIICNKCNQGIGALGDSIDGVRRALNYLERAQQLPPRRAAPAIRINLLQGAN